MDNVRCICKLKINCNLQIQHFIQFDRFILMWGWKNNNIYNTTQSRRKVIKKVTPTNTNWYLLSVQCNYFCFIMKTTPFFNQRSKTLRKSKTINISGNFLEDKITKFCLFDKECEDELWVCLVLLLSVTRRVIPRDAV